jgi:hypothetical protein
MTRDQLNKRVDELLIELNIKEEIMNRINKVINQGAIDLEAYENDFRLPKTLMHCALESLAWQYKPLTWDKMSQKEVKNIKIFM